jgi:hypothetical protein
MPGSIILVANAPILVSKSNAAVSTLAEHPLLLSVSTTKSPS